MKNLLRPLTRQLYQGRTKLFITGLLALAMVGAVMTFAGNGKQVAILQPSGRQSVDRDFSVHVQVKPRETTSKKVNTVLKIDNKIIDARVSKGKVKKNEKKSYRFGYGKRVKSPKTIITSAGPVNGQEGDPDEDIEADDDTPPAQDGDTGTPTEDDEDFIEDDDEDLNDGGGAAGDGTGDDETGDDGDDIGLKNSLHLALPQLFGTAQAASKKDSTLYFNQRLLSPGKHKIEVVSKDGDKLGEGKVIDRDEQTITVKKPRSLVTTNGHVNIKAPVRGKAIRRPGDTRVNNKSRRDELRATSESGQNRLLAQFIETTEAHDDKGAKHGNVRVVTKTSDGTVLPNVKVDVDPNCDGSGHSETGKDAEVTFHKCPVNRFTNSSRYTVRVGTTPAGWSLRGSHEQKKDLKGAETETFTYTYDRIGGPQDGGPGGGSGGTGGTPPAPGNGGTPPASGENYNPKAHPMLALTTLSSTHARVDAFSQAIANGKHVGTIKSLETRVDGNEPTVHQVVSYQKQLTISGLLLKLHANLADGADHLLVITARTDTDQTAQVTVHIQKANVAAPPAAPANPAPGNPAAPAPGGNKPPQNPAQQNPNTQPGTKKATPKPPQQGQPKASPTPQAPVPGQPNNNQSGGVPKPGLKPIDNNPGAKPPTQNNPDQGEAGENGEEEQNQEDEGVLDTIGGSVTAVGTGVGKTASAVAGTVGNAAGTILDILPGQDFDDEDGDTEVTDEEAAEEDEEDSEGDDGNDEVAGSDKKEASKKKKSPGRTAAEDEESDDLSEDEEADEETDGTATSVASATASYAGLPLPLKIIVLIGFLAFIGAGVYIARKGIMKIRGGE